MRKILLATTAFVAAGGVSAATADFSISGSSSFNYVQQSVSGAGEDTAEERDMNSEVDFSLKASKMLDNGLLAAGQMDLHEGETTVDDFGFTLSGDFGTFGFAGLANDAFGKIETDITADEGTTIDKDVYGINEVTDSQVPHSDVSFTSNSIAGFQFALGMSDGAATDSDGNAIEETDHDGSQVGLTYTFDIGKNMSATLGYNKHSVGTDAGDASSTGASVTFGDLNVKVASHMKAVGGDTGDVTSTTIGASYAVSDTLSVQAYTGSAEASMNDAYEMSDTAYGLTYTITPGLSVSVTHNSYNADTGVEAEAVDGTRTALALDVSF